jgi:hypothetical protein
VLYLKIPQQNGSPPLFSTSQSGTFKKFEPTLDSKRSAAYAFEPLNYSSIYYSNKIIHSLISNHIKIKKLSQMRRGFSRKYVSEINVT